MNAVQVQCLQFAYDLTFSKNINYGSLTESERWEMKSVCVFTVQ